MQDKCIQARNYSADVWIGTPANQGCVRDISIPKNGS